MFLQRERCQRSIYDKYIICLPPLKTIKIIPHVLVFLDIVPIYTNEVHVTAVKEYIYSDMSLPANVAVLLLLLSSFSYINDSYGG
jgi:hypothetical protein